MSPIVPASGSPRASITSTSSGAEALDRPPLGVLAAAELGLRSSRSGT